MLSSLSFVKSPVQSQFLSLGGCSLRPVAPLRPTSYSCLIDYSQIDATKYLKKYGYKLEAALDGLYSDPAAVAAIAAGSREANGTVSNSKIGEIFDDFKGGADVIC